MGGSQTIPEKIKLSDLQTETGGSKFIENMKNYGYNVLELDDQSNESLLEYLRVTSLFFEQAESTKRKLSHVDEIMGQVNKGYISVKYVKEFLKLKKGDSIPDEIEGFEESFAEFWEDINNISERCYTLLGTAIDEYGDHYMDEKLFNEVKERIPQRSSISMIHYHPRLPPNERPEDDLNGDDVDGFSVPSKVHTDTGVLTLISCSDVPGLQVEDRESGKFLEVEKLFDPRRDLFCIMGRKIELFAQNSPPMFKATVHRVHLPYNVERQSMLYFVDVPQ